MVGLILIATDIGSLTGRAGELWLCVFVPLCVFLSINFPAESFIFLRSIFLPTAQIAEAPQISEQLLL